MVPFKFAEDLPSLPSWRSKCLSLAEWLWPRIGTLFGFFSRISREKEKRTGMGRATLLARTAAHAAVLVLTFSEFKTLSLFLSPSHSLPISMAAWLSQNSGYYVGRKSNASSAPPITTPSGGEVADAREGMFHSSLWPLSWSWNKSGASLVRNSNLQTKSSSSLHDFSPGHAKRLR